MAIGLITGCKNDVARVWTQVALLGNSSALVALGSATLSTQEASLYTYELINPSFPID